MSRGQETINGPTSRRKKEDPREGGRKAQNTCEVGVEGDYRSTSRGGGQEQNQFKLIKSESSIRKLVILYAKLIHKLPNA